MNTAAYVQSCVIPASYELLPPKLNVVQATALLLAIGFQESGFEHRHQIGGPAHGWWQFERGGVAGVLRHPVTAPLVAPILDTLHYENDASEVYDAIEHNDILACIVARLNLFWNPKALPNVGDTDASWHYYIATWRPGKPRRDAWDEHVERAWAMC